MNESKKYFNEIRKLKKQVSDLENRCGEMELILYRLLWFKEKLFVDIYGREPNLSDIPMTYMTRSEVFKKRHFSRKQINKLWKQEHK